MRMRKKKNADLRFDRCAELAINPDVQFKEEFYTVFDKDKPLKIEIG